MPRTKEQFAAMRRSTNEKILSAAIKLFSRKGVFNVTIQEIANEAELSVGLLYRHYKTKDSIFAALVQMAIDGLKQAGEQFDGEPVDVIKCWTKEVLNDISKNDEFVQFMHILSPTSVADGSFPKRETILEANKYFQHQITEVITRGQYNGAFREGNPVGMAQYLLTIVTGLCSMKLALKDSFVIPTPAMITTFLLKEEYNVYE